MRMPRVTWTVLITILAVGLLAIGAYALNGDQTAMSQASAATASQMPAPSSSAAATCTAPVAAVPAASCQTPCVTTTTVAPPCPTACPPPCPPPAQTCAVPCPAGVTTWDDCKETTITGCIICLPACGHPTDVDASMIIKTGDGVSHRIWLAPLTMLTNLGFCPNLNDQVSIIGMCVGNCGDFIARQVVYGCNTYTIRDHCGAPLWAIGMDQGFASYATLWDPNRMFTFKGWIDRVQYVYPGGEEYGPGVAIRVARTLDDNVPSWQQPPVEFTPPYVWAHLGPDQYVKSQTLRPRLRLSGSGRHRLSGKLVL